MPQKKYTPRKVKSKKPMTLSQLKKICGGDLNKVKSCIKAVKS